MSVDNPNYTILYFLDYGKSFGGAANALLQQAVLMKRAGHQTILYFSDYLGNQMDDDYKKICQDLGIEWKWTTYQISSQTEDIDVVCLDRNYEKIKKEITSYNPDILHSVQINPCVELVSRELKIPHIMNIYQLIPDFFSVYYLGIFPHYHLCDSWYFAQKWQHYLKTDSSCVRTVVNSNRKRNLLNSFPLNYICVGNVSKRKNQLTVIKAFQKIFENGIDGRLVLCGYADGSYAELCRRYIEENMLGDKVFMKGFCPNMKAEYAVNDVLVCGSIMESYPNVISEAMASGLVIISTPVAGVPEVIKDGVNGYLADDYSEDAIYEKIMQFQRDLTEGRVVQILENAEKSFQKYHAPQEVMRQLQQYYKYVLSDYDKRKREENAAVIGITSIRNNFGGLLQKFTQGEECFIESQKVALKLWYLYHTEERIMSAFYRNRDFYIWGTGKYGVIVKELVDFFLPRIQISGFLDSNKTGTYLGYNIYSPDEIVPKENIVVFIAAMNGQDEMIEKLESQKKVFNKDYFILSPRSW